MKKLSPLELAWRNYTGWVETSRKKLYYKYHFCRDYTFDTISKGGIYVSSFKELNDPFDPFSSKLWEHNPWGEWDNIDSALIILNASNFPRLFCVSETPRSELMWSHYANNHKGFCIGYEDPTPVLLKIVYTSQISETKSYLEGRGGWAGQNWKFVIKTPPWSYEKEWRYLYPGLPDEKGEPIYSPFKIREVILGARMEQADMKTLIEATKEFKPTYKKVAAEVINGRCVLRLTVFDIEKL